MVFSSVPVYLDPSNWSQHHQAQEQQQHTQHGQLPSDGGMDAHAHHHHDQSPPVRPPHGGALMAPRPDMEVVVSASGNGPTGGGSAIRAGSMSERARLAKIPQPEPGLKCPRCESTNTKFCYFNNYSLSQPRHFCKTCRRYWTRGGALRNVPVGGGCRRNKHTKSSKSNSSSVASASSAGGTLSSISSTATGGSRAGTMMLSHQGQLQPFLDSMQHPLVGGDHYNISASRLGFLGLSSLDPMDYQQFGAGAGASSATIGLEQWRLPQIQQFPFLSGQPDVVQPTIMSGIYPFDMEGQSGDTPGLPGGHMLGGSKMPGSAGLITQLASVKMEDNPASVAMASSSPRDFLSVPGNLQFWVDDSDNDGASANNEGGVGNASGGGGSGVVAPGTSWVDLSGFNSSSSGKVL